MENTFQNEPISKIEWVDAGQLKANDYNPNMVFNKELELLKFSILKNGWIQPILITKDNVIIDGYHRFFLSKNDKDIIKKYQGKCPVVIMDINEAERKLLTIRINRAKGSHIAIKMSDIVKNLIDLGLDKKYIADSIGANLDEVELLLMEDVFEKLDIKNHRYSKAWTPILTKDLKN